MTTEYEPKLLVGNLLSEVETSDSISYEGDRWDLRDLLESQGMCHCEQEDFVGFEMDTILKLNGLTLGKISEQARKFERVTGIPAHVAACVNIY